MSTSCLFSHRISPRDAEGNSLLHIAGKSGDSEIAMLLLSILWRKSVLFSGYPDFMHVNAKGEDASEVTQDASLRSLIHACIDRYSVVNVNNLEEGDTLESMCVFPRSFAVIRNRIIESSTMKESIRQSKFIVNDCMVMKEQESGFPARLCAMNGGSFVIYIPPTLHMLEQVGVEVKNPESVAQKDALRMLVYSFSHGRQESYQSSFSLMKTGRSENSSRMMSVMGESRNRIYKPVAAGGSDEEKRRMVENNMRECVIVWSVCLQERCVVVAFMNDMKIC